MKAKKARLPLSPSKTSTYVHYIITPLTGPTNVHPYSLLLAAEAVYIILKDYFITSFLFKNYVYC